MDDYKDGKAWAGYAFKEREVVDKPLMRQDCIKGKGCSVLVNGKGATLVKASTIKDLPKKDFGSYYCVKDYKNTIYCFYEGFISDY